MEKNKDLVAHRFILEAHWSIKEQKFVKYERLVMEGSIEKIAGLMNAVGKDTPQVKSLLTLAYKGAIAPMRAPNVIPPRRPPYKSPTLKVDGDEQDVSNMTDEEIEAMIRAQDSDRE